MILLYLRTLCDASSHDRKDMWWCKWQKIQWNYIIREMKSLKIVHADWCDSMKMFFCFCFSRYFFSSSSCLVKFWNTTSEINFQQAVGILCIVFVSFPLQQWKHCPYQRGTIVHTLSCNLTCRKTFVQIKRVEVRKWFLAGCLLSTANQFIRIKQGFVICI